MAAQSAVIAEYHSSIPLLINSYHAHFSRLDNLALWYGTLYWPLQYGLLSIVVLLGGLVGFLLNTAALFAVLSLGVSLIGHYLLKEHYSNSETRDAEFKEKLSVFESSLKESQAHLVAVEVQLKEILTTLYTLNLRQAEGLEDLKVQIDMLEHEIDFMAELTQELDTIKISFEAEMSGLKLGYEQQLSISQKANQSMLCNVTELEQTEGALDKTVVSISNSEDLLQKVIDKIAEKTSTLDSLMSSVKSSAQNSPTKSFITPSFRRSRGLLLSAERVLSHYKTNLNYSGLFSYQDSQSMKHQHSKGTPVVESGDLDQSSAVKP